ncbi:DUF3309 family protein [Roseovarius gahaiensis]
MALPPRPPRAAGPQFHNLEKERAMLGPILIVLLVLVLLSALSAWGHSRTWGYGPRGGRRLILVIVVVMGLTRRL